MYSVTILLASYNRLDFLKEAVTSALIQEYPDFEVLVIDDGSTEESRAWLRQASARQDRLRVIFQEHQGVGFVRTKGVKEARKDLICILDSDDRLVPGALARIVRVFEEHPDTDLAYVNIRHVLPNGLCRDRFYRQFECNSAMIWGTFLFPRVPFKHSGTTYRRDVALELGAYDVTLPRKLDIDFFLKFLKGEKRLRLVQGEPLLLFRVHSESLSRNRVLGIKAWSLLIDRHGPRNPLLRLGIKTCRAFAEIMKIVYVRIRGE